MTQQQALLTYCLRLGDDALIQSYRLSEWCSSAPILEEDLALTNFALDMTGRAQALLGYAGIVEGAGRTADNLAYKRGERKFMNHQIVELPNGNFATTMARLLLTATCEYYMYAELLQSKDETMAAIAAKTVKEAKYHMAHAADWVLRLGDGTAESHEKMQSAMDHFWPFTGELFETDAATQLLCDSHIAADPAKVKAAWEKHIHQVVQEATLTLPGRMHMQTGGTEGIHTEYLGHILSEMQYLQRAYPEAIW